MLPTVLLEAAGYVWSCALSGAVAVIYRFLFVGVVLCAGSLVVLWVGFQ
jgi:hypothetical protein